MLSPSQVLSIYDSDPLYHRQTDTQTDSLMLLKDTHAEKTPCRTLMVPAEVLWQIQTNEKDNLLSSDAQA